MKKIVFVLVLVGSIFWGCNSENIDRRISVRVKVEHPITREALEGIYCEIAGAKDGIGTGDLSIGGSSVVELSGITDADGVFTADFVPNRNKEYYLQVYNSRNSPGSSTLNGITGCEPYNWEPLEAGEVYDFTFYKAQTCTLVLSFNPDPALATPDSFHFEMPDYKDFGCNIPYSTFKIVDIDDLDVDPRKATPITDWPSGPQSFRWEVFRNGSSEVFEKEFAYDPEGLYELNVVY